eukprot:g6236.t1
MPVPLVTDAHLHDPPSGSPRQGSNELTLDHFSTSSDHLFDPHRPDAFEPVTWLNANLADIGALSTSLQLLCQEEQEAVDALSVTLVDRFPTTLYHLERLKQEVDVGASKCNQAIKSLSKAASKDSFGVLTDMALTKERLEVAKVALRELQMWDKKIQEVHMLIVDDLLRGGELVEVIDRIRGAQDVCDCFSELPEYEERVGSLRNFVWRDQVLVPPYFETELHTLARRKLSLSLEQSQSSSSSSEDEDLRMASEVFVRCGNVEELNSLVRGHYENYIVRKSMVVLEKANASSTGEAIRHCFENLANTSREVGRANAVLAGRSVLFTGAGGSSSSRSGSKAATGAGELFASAQVGGRLSQGGSDLHSLDPLARKRAVYQKLKLRARNVLSADHSSGDGAIGGTIIGEASQGGGTTAIDEAMEVEGDLSPDKQGLLNSPGGGDDLLGGDDESPPPGGMAGSSSQVEANSPLANLQKTTSYGQNQMKQLVIELPATLHNALDKMHELLFNSLNSCESSAAGAQDEEQLTRRTSFVLAMWLSYVDGCEQLVGSLRSGISGNQVPGMARVAEETMDTVFKAFPIWLLLDTVKYVYQPGLRDCLNLAASGSKVAAAHDSQQAAAAARSKTASEALLSAETETVKKMQSLVKFARKDDVYLLSSSGTSFLAYASIDWLFSVLLREALAPLEAIFRNTIDEKAKSQAAAAAHMTSIDANLLNQCLGFYKVLTHLETQIGNELEAPLLDHVRTVNSAGGSGVPYPLFASGLRRKFGKEGIKQLQAEFKNCRLEDAYNDEGRMHQSRAEIEKLSQGARKLVVTACVAPVQNLLHGYASSLKSVWEQPGAVQEADAAGVSPQQVMTYVGEQLFGMVPILEHSGLVEEWLQLALHEVARLVISHALQISKLSKRGFLQLLCDLEYVHNVVSALASSSSPALGSQADQQLQQTEDGGGNVLEKGVSVEKKEEVEEDLHALFVLVAACKAVDGAEASSTTDLLKQKYERTIRQMLQNFSAAATTSGAGGEQTVA